MFSVEARRFVYFLPPTWVLWVLDFFFWLFSFQYVEFFRFHFKNYETAQSHEEVEYGQEVRIFRDRESFLYPSIYDGLPFDILKNRADQDPDGICFQYREFEESRFDEGRKILVFGSTRQVSNFECFLQIRNLGYYLTQVENLLPPPKYPFSVLQPDFRLSQGSSVLIYVDTCWEFFVTLVSCFSQGLVVVTCYSSLGPEAVKVCIEQCRPEVIFCNKDKLPVLIQTCENTVVRTIVYYEHLCSKEIELPKSQLNLVSFYKVLKGNEKLCKSQVARDSLAIVMYTSGSTGVPKGVVMTHGNLYSTSQACAQKFRCLTKRLPKDPTAIVSLPLSHVLEVSLCFSYLELGISLSFCCPKSLSSRDCLPRGGFAEFRPSFFTGVPKIYEILQKAVENEISKKNFFVRYFFRAGYLAKETSILQGRNSPLFNWLLFNKMKEITGGRLLIAVSGGGPLDPSVQRFISTCFNCSCIQGYGLTETAGPVSVGQKVEPLSVGYPLGLFEFKLRIPHSKGEPVLDRDGKVYSPKDRYHFNTRCLGRGEICIRGPGVALGYLNNEETTREAFEGWFYSGDVGYFSEKNKLYIVDRVKSIVKLKGGEYVALDQMQNCLTKSEYVNVAAGGLLVVADGTMDRPVAVVQVARRAINKFADAEESDLILEAREVKLAVIESFNQIADEDGLGRLERVSNVHLVLARDSDTLTKTSSWTPENLGLTAANKINRSKLEVLFNSEIEKLKRQRL